MRGRGPRCRCWYWRWRWCRLHLNSTDIDAIVHDAQKAGTALIRGERWIPRVDRRTVVRRQMGFAGNILPFLPRIEGREGV
jgi:hypothetical protein